MTKKIFTTTALLFCFMVCFAIVADITGKWTGAIKMPDGNELPVTYDFKVDGNKLTGTAESPNGTVSIDNGKIDGDNFSFSVNVNGTDYPHKGKAYADSCAMDISIDQQTIHFVIKKADK